ncbi:MAG: 3-hydroxyacyl-ACP dehydratase FabZ [Syntrophaceticus sp.]|nr:3-hydroxyacyl-ACP dehydratase FabZ [Syntrophaceticus sp.]MDD3313976.1 3-hydroxyacyl-ACP dehydratase FabZ [Syntrophaceticus sp.]MDD4359053.1 3-hydroxyacyl-ACP dehydratase FabZ [Syntrophaceticus sp.]MDD4783122.1 3-hydroxyacyl-ACP dehydratase FabZ [Syntrophaceticus sp.]
MLNIDEIMSILPHRYPFLLVDRILELEPGKRAVGLKNVTINEPFFQGHFPGTPVLPGVLILEALAQVGACALLGQEEHKNSLAYLAGVDKFRFRRVVVPGDQLLLEVEMLKLKASIGKAKGKATVDGDTAAEGEFLFALEAR